jgi:hypothetical protein
MWLMGCTVVSGISNSPTPSAHPLFTIAIPTFNRAHWLRHCINSALSQTFGDLEVVVSDNASDDETVEVLREFSDQRLVVLRQPVNIGAVGNWNACLATASGAYIVMLSDDDSVAPHFLERSSALITEDVDLPVIVTLGDVYDSSTGLTRPALTSRVLRSGVREGMEILKEFLQDNITPQMCTIAIKTETLRARGGFPEGWPHTGDLVSWVPLLLQGKAGFINESCGTYHSHAETQTAKLSLESRLNDFERLACAINRETEYRVRDPLIVADLQRLVRRYVARNLIGHMAMQRSRGARRKDITSAAWSRRKQLLGAGIIDLRTLIRPLALLMLPLPMIRLVSRAKRVFLVA